MSDASPTSPVPIITANDLTVEFAHTEAIGDLALALSLAQGAFRPAEQSAENPHFKKKYADLSDVMEVCRAPLTANGLAIFQPPSNKVGASTVTVTTMLVHKSGQWMRCSLTCGAQMNNPQSVGSVITYLKRYGLCGMLGLTSRGEDDDGETGAGRGGSPAQSPPAAQRQASTASKPATQGAPTGTALPQPATIPEAVKPFADRFDKVADKAEFDALLNSTSKTFDEGTAERKAYVVAVKRAAARLGIEAKKPAPTTGATP